MALLGPDRPHQGGAFGYEPPAPPGSHRHNFLAADRIYMMPPMHGKMNSLLAGCGMSTDWSDPEMCAWIAWGDSAPPRLVVESCASWAGFSSSSLSKSRQSKVGSLGHVRLLGPTGASPAARVLGLCLA